MCSVNDAEDELIPRGIGKPERSCFMNYFVHKFRATLGKSKAVRQGEKVLVAFSGGPSSCCLLHLIKEGLSEGAHKKLRFVPEILFINEGATLGWSAEKIEEVNNDVKIFASKLGFSIDIVALEQLYSSNVENQSSSENNEKISDEDDLGTCCGSGGCKVDTNASESEASATTQLVRSFAALKSLTAKQDFVFSLRNNLLRDYAKVKQCTKIIVAETSTRLSIKLLLNISHGRGGSLPLDVGVSDSRDGQVAAIRPMRELTSKEVAFYNRMQSVEPVVTESMDTMAADNASLQKQTEAFVTNLQASFPSTVSTVFRTGDKLSINDELMSTDENCIMCKAPLAEVKSSVSQVTKATEEMELQGCCGKGDGSCQRSSKEMPRSGNDTSHLPPFVLQEFERASRRSRMKDSIQEFLID
eukprot:gene9221-16903_t